MIEKEYKLKSTRRGNSYIVLYSDYLKVANSTETARLFFGRRTKQLPLLETIFGINFKFSGGDFGRKNEQEHFDRKSI